MADPTIDAKIRDYLVRTLLIRFDGPKAVSEEADLFAAGIIDSFAFVQLVAYLEKEFKIKITDAEALGDAMSSLSRIRALVERKVPRG